MNETVFSLIIGIVTAFMTLAPLIVVSAIPPHELSRRHTTMLVKDYAKRLRISAKFERRAEEQRRQPRPEGEDLERSHDGVKQVHKNHVREADERRRR